MSNVTSLRSRLCYTASFEHFVDIFPTRRKGLGPKPNILGRLNRRPDTFARPCGQTIFSTGLVLSVQRSCPRRVCQRRYSVCPCTANVFCNKNRMVAERTAARGPLAPLAVAFIHSTDNCSQVRCCLVFHGRFCRCYDADSWYFPRLRAGGMHNTRDLRCCRGGTVHEPLTRHPFYLASCHRLYSDASFAVFFE